MKDILVVVEMLRDHDVTAEVKFKKLLEKTKEKMPNFYKRKHGVVKILKYEMGKVSLCPMP